MTREASTQLPQPIFHEPIFGEGGALPDPTGFSTRHGSDEALYKQIGDLAKKDIVAIPKSRSPDEALFSLACAYGHHGAQITQKIEKAGRIIFHALGYSGASNSGKYPDELRVADQVTLDCRASAEADRAAFLFHLGDIVYNFGEARYYYDQFNEPFRNYPAPIFAIPGNHDSFIVPGTNPENVPLVTFQRNFCSENPVITSEAGSLHRTAMTQPGVYFALDAPFVRIIGLFSNALEDPGVISSEKGKWASVPNSQLDYLRKQLARIKSENYSGAVLLAVHHPPFSYEPPPKSGGAGGNHSGSPNMLRQIDAICKAEGVYPHAVLSGHAHNYQRFTRTIRFKDKDLTVPFIICGDGGHNVNKLVKSRRGQVAREPYFGVNVDYLESNPAVEAKSLVLKHYDDVNYGYLRITVDKTLLRIGFQQVAKMSIPQSRIDMVTVDLASRTIVAN